MERNIAQKDDHIHKVLYNLCGDLIMFESMNSFLKILSTLTHRAGAFVFLPALAILITLDVILRYIAAAPLVWSHEVNGFFLLCLFFGSLTYCWNKGRHIRMLMIFNQFNGPMKIVATIVATLTGILFFGALGVQSFMEIPFMIETNETGEMFTAPHWPFKVFIGVCSFIFISCLILNLYSLFFHKDTKRNQQ